MPIVPHQVVGDDDCCGCLIVVERDGQADLTCNECSEVFKTVPMADVESELQALAIPGFQTIEAFVCRGCREGNAVTNSVQ